MAKVFIEEATLTAIGDAIRNKTGKADLIDPALMSTEIASIEAGGGDLPEEALTITGSCYYRFARGGWDWFVEAYGNKVKTEGITDLDNAFYYTGLTKIPFVLNVTNISNLVSFISGSSLTECPKVRGTFKFDTNFSMSYAINNCTRIRDFEDLFEPEALDGFSSIKVTNSYSSPRVPVFTTCYSLRKVPSWWYKFKLCPESTAWPSSSGSLYYGTFNGCRVLDEVLNLPVWVCVAPATSGQFTYSPFDCARAKNITFETDNGQPIVANWKSQTVDLTTVGKASSSVTITPYGITADKEVKDDATYQALKNDPDWFTAKVEYSRYNHDSAVNTINSLPDTSAYLASAGGTNTIKFKGAAGANTDGGAINTLTAEEIAVAAAKGWTVTLV